MNQSQPPRQAGRLQALQSGLPIAAAVLLALQCHIVAHAGEKPAIERLSPAGGQTGTEVQVSLMGKPGDDELQLWSDRQQLQFVFSEKQDSATVKIPADATPGVHWLRFFNASGTTTPLPFIVGTLPEHPEAEPNNRFNEANMIDTSTAVINGVLHKSGEVDCYTIAVKQGQTLVASMLANRTLNSPMDAVLQLLDSRGTILRQNDDDHGLDPQIAYEAEQDQTLTVRTFAFPAAPNSTIQFAGAANYVYRLTLTTGPIINHCLPAVVTTGQQRTIDLVGWNIPDQDRKVSIEAPTDPALASLELPMKTFAFPLHLSQVPHPSFTEDQVASELSVPFTVSGHIRMPDETDEVRFAGSKGQKLRCRTIARADYSLLDPLMTLLGPDGRELKQADDVSKTNLDADLNMTLPSDGTYTLRLTDRFDHGGFRYFYRLQVEETRPDFTLNVQQDSFVVLPDTPAEITINVNRIDGFAETIQITVADLPAGINCIPVTSQPDGDSAKAVKLKLEGQLPTGYSGVFEIQGSTTDDRQQKATSGNIHSEGPVTLLWLTVPGSIPQDPVSPDEKPEAAPAAAPPES